MSTITRIAAVGVLLALVWLTLARATAQPSPAASPSASPVASPAASPVAAGGSVSVTGHVTIHISDAGYGPAYVQATNGHDLTNTVVNDGKRPHGFTIDQLGIDLTVRPGQSATTVVKNPPLGDFDYHSTLPGDDALRGQLTFYI